MDADDGEDEEAFEESLFGDNSDQMIQDEDFTAFTDFEDELAQADEDFMKSLFDEDN